MASSRLSRLVAHPRIVRRLMKGNFDPYVLWPLTKKFQNWIVDQSTARKFTVLFEVKTSVYRTWNVSLSIECWIIIWRDIFQSLYHPKISLIVNERRRTSILQNVRLKLPICIPFIKFRIRVQEGFILKVNQKGVSNKCVGRKFSWKHYSKASFYAIIVSQKNVA